MPEPLTVNCAYPLSEEQIADLESIDSRVRVHMTHRTEMSDELLAQTEVFVGFGREGSLPFDRMPNLRWFQRFGAGVDGLVKTALWAREDVLITTASGTHRVAIPEYVIGMILAHAHRFPTLFDAQREKKWLRNVSRSVRATELEGQTLGVVGLGAIGREVARLGAAFGMRVIGTRHSGQPVDHVEEVLPPERVRELLATSDYVVLAAPLTPATRRLIDAEALAAMKPNAFLINVARGGLVDEAALVEALRDGKIGGAALDVFDEEPLPEDSPFWGLDNTVVTPHVSGISTRYTDRAFAIFRENLRRYVAGEPMLNVVDRARGY